MAKDLNSYDWPDPTSVEALATTLRETTASERLQWLDDMLELAYLSGAIEKSRRLHDAERDAERTR